MIMPNEESYPCPVEMVFDDETDELTDESLSSINDICPFCSKCGVYSEGYIPS